MKKCMLLSLLLCAALLLSSCTSQTPMPKKPSGDKFAGGEYVEESVKEESSKPVEESSKPVEESSAPAEESSAVESSAPVEESSAAESSAPVEESSNPAEESSAPVEESSNPAEESSAPVEESSKPAEESSKPAEESSAPAEESSKPAEESSKPAEESSAPVEESSKPAEESSAPAEESSAPAAKDPATYTIVDWLGTTEAKADYIIAQTIENYLYDYDMEAVLDHMSNPSYYNSQTVAWYIDDTGEIYYSIPNFNNTAYLDIPSGILVTGALYNISDYFEWTGRCVGPWATKNAETANFFYISFSGSGDFYLGYGWQYSEFFGFDQGPFSFNQAGTQVSIDLAEHGTCTFDFFVNYEHIILVQRSDTGLVTGDPAGTIYVFTMMSPY